MKFSFFFLFFFASLCSSARAASHTREEIRDWADLLFNTVDQPDELNDPSLSAVTRTFGPTVIPLASLPIDSPMAVAEKQPWSSWWFPKIDRDLFDDGFGTSPLEKFDFVRGSLTGQSSRAAAIEKKAYDPTRPRWEGLCDAWAIAATLFPEPRAPKTMKLPSGATVSFSVSDQKALLLKTVDSVPAEAFQVFGQRFTGSSEGWIFPDLFPQELHRYVEKQLFEKHAVFIMDHDPGVEVWSEPVFKANYKITAVPGRTDAVFVRLWLYSATSLKKKDQKEKVGISELAREYDYFLYGKQDGAGGLVVTGGVWAKGDIVDSRRDHPDFVYSVANPAAVTRKSQNPELDSAVVDKILER